MAKNEERWRQIWSQLKEFWAGYQIFKRTGQTPVESYYAMRRLYVHTNGWFNDTFQFIYGLANPYKPVKSLEASLFKRFTWHHVKAAVQGLRRDGYYVFPQRIDSEHIDALMQHSLTTPANLQIRGKYIENTNTRFNPNELVASIYRFPEKGVVNIPAVQNLMADPVLISIAQQYMKSQVVYVNTGLSWITPYGGLQPASDLAQHYHFDMDRIKFMKFFLYLTDVDPLSGPHCYVRGSCQRKPRPLLEDRRFQDAELKGFYRDDDLKELTAPRGTLLAVDTRGFHKAKVPTAGNRLMLQLEIASCLFGQNYPRAPIELKEQKAVASLKENPYLWSNYELSSKTLQSREKVLT